MTRERIKERKTVAVRRRNYREKNKEMWSCKVCKEQYETSTPYCLSCYQGLYYYCYVNAELFVQKDLAYLELYYDSPVESDEEEEQVEIGESCQDFDWIEQLIE